ncbi:MAG: NADP-reducing hydrogenase subunit HndB [Phycisphaerae bacterium]|nr:NADP-reducing hydrogenase subunit HndB [Phycisphaerae bacterium]
MAQRIASPEDLKAVREKAQQDIDLRSGQKELRITVHMGTCGIAAGARDLLTVLMNELQQNQVTYVSVTQTGCAGLCDQEPMITITDKNGSTFRYGRLSKAKVGEVVRGHVLRGQPMVEYLIKI